MSSEVLGGCRSEVWRGSRRPEAWNGGRDIPPDANIFHCMNILFVSCRSEMFDFWLVGTSAIVQVSKQSSQRAATTISPNPCTYLA